jgi:tRNA (guanine-N7-)-methyltransferase
MGAEAASGKDHFAAARYRLHGRRKGKKLRPGQAALLRDALPRLAVSLPEPGRLLDPRGLFASGCREVWLEIGFGGGEHLAAQAAAHREIGFIGSEVYLNGVVKLLGLIAGPDAAGGKAPAARAPLENVRIFPEDARLLIEALLPASIGGVFMLFPDPWPKTRHHKRRLVSEETLTALARVMAPGAELRLATDDPAYRDAMLETLAAARAFEGPAGGAQGLALRPTDWPPTRYEAKALAGGAACRYLIYRRRDA